jgi:hypothetical protein
MSNKVFHLLGYDNPLGHYPAPVVPVGLLADKSTPITPLVAVYSNEQGSSFVVLKYNADFVALDARALEILEDFDPNQHRLFALNKRDIKFYPVENEQRVFLQLLKQKFFATQQPFLRLALAKVVNNVNILQRELTICTSLMLRSSPDVVDSWYKGQLELLQEHVSDDIFRTLPSNWRELPNIAKSLSGSRGAGFDGVSSASDSQQVTRYGAGAAMARVMVATGLFRSREAFEYACQSIVSLGYSLTQVNVLMSDAALLEYFPEVYLDEKPTASTGGTDDWWNQTSALTEQIIDMITTGSAFTFPQYNIFIAGPLHNWLINKVRGHGAVPSDVVELLTGEGISEGVARQFERGITEGGIVVTIEPNNKEGSERIADEWLYDAS